MTDDQKSKPSDAAKGPAARAKDAPTTTRDEFLRNAVKKAAFIMPVVWTLTAQQALAQVGSAYCAMSGQACLPQLQCCPASGMCESMICQ